MITVRAFADADADAAGSACAGGVRAHQRRLQLGRALGRDQRVGQRSEAGRHAVHRLRSVDEAVGEAIDDGGAPLDGRPGVVAELDPPPFAGG